MALQATIQRLLRAGPRAQSLRPFSSLAVERTFVPEVPVSVTVNASKDECPFITKAELSTRGAAVDVTFADGKAFSFPLVMLANNSIATGALNHWTGQKLTEIPSLIDAVGRDAVVSLRDATYPRPAKRYGNSGQVLQVTAGATDIVVPTPWLRQEMEALQRVRSPNYEELPAYCGNSHGFWSFVLAATREPHAQPLLWRPEIFQEHGIPEMDWRDVSSCPVKLSQYLGLVRVLGFAVLRNAPPEHDTVTKIAELFGHVRGTVPYGEVFDVKSEADAYHMANTAAGLALHSDNPYRRPVPSLQVLHCLTNASEGGHSTLQDAWAVAQRLRDTSPRAFDALTSAVVGWEFRKSCGFGDEPLAPKTEQQPHTHFRDAGAWLYDEAPVIELDVAGRISLTRFNDRSMTTPRVPAEQLQQWYSAYGVYATQMTEATPCLEFRLEGGDALIFDNARLLHGRTAFTVPRGADGVFRHLRGCYSDCDGLRSTHRALLMATAHKEQPFRLLDEACWRKSTGTRPMVHCRKAEGSSGNAVAPQHETKVVRL